MLTKEVYEICKEKAKEFYEKAGIVITKDEYEKMQVAEYNLNMVNEIGLEIIEYVNTERCCAKELVLFPYQTCPQHRHPEINGELGKEETFRCRYGEVYLYVSGDGNKNNIKAKLPKGKEECFTVFHEIILKPGEQYTLSPNTWHWFQGGAEGAVVSEFSTRSRDPFDIYEDKDINPCQNRTL